MQLVKTLTRVGIIAAAATMLATATPAFAASRDGVCNTGEFCYYYNSGEAGSISDFTGSIADYGTTQPSCYDFKGAGNGKGVCVKNNAASVWNRSSKTVRVYFNSGYAGAYQDFAAGAKGNLNATLKNHNASHQFITLDADHELLDRRHRRPAHLRAGRRLGQQPHRQHVARHRHLRPRRRAGLRLGEQRLARRLRALDAGSRGVQARGRAARCRPVAWPSSRAAPRASVT